MRSKAINVGLVLAGILCIVASAGLFYGLTEGSKPQHLLPMRDEKRASFERPRELGKRTDVIVKAQKKVLKIPIITYHYVEIVKDPKDTMRKKLSVNPYTFEQEVKALSENGYTTYFLKDIPHLVDGTMPYASKSAVLTFDDGYEDFYTDVFPVLKKYNVRATYFLVNNFVNRPGFVTDSQVETILHSGLVEIGAHTMNHAYLKSLPVEKARQEVVLSKQGLEKKYGIQIESFAYPFGVFNKDTVDIVKEASFSAAVSEIVGSIQSDENMFYLSRIRAGRFSGANIVSILEGLKI